MKYRWGISAVALVALAMTGAGCGDDPGGEPPTADASDDVADTSTPDVTEETIEEGGTDATDGGTEVADAPPQPTLDVQILSVSDWHGQLEPLPAETNVDTQVRSIYGGISALSSYWKKDRAENPNTITVTSGDVTGATPSLTALATDLPDEPAILAMNFLGLNVDTLGNHNFDRGIEHYAKLIDLAKYKIVSSNLQNVTVEFPGNKPADAKLGSEAGKPRINTGYVMLDVGTPPNVVKVAFIGITNPDAPKLLFPGQMKSINVENPAVKASEHGEAARKAGAHVVVVLAHMGAQGTDVAGKPVGPLIEMASTIKPGTVDLILGDHTNQLVNTVVNGIAVHENLSAGRTYAKTSIKVVDGKVTKVEPKTIDPVSTETVDVEILTDAGGTPVKCNSGLACPSATPSWTCSSTTTKDGFCRRAQNCGGATPVTKCPTGFTCATSGSSAGKQCVRTAMALDPEGEKLLEPWRQSLRAKFDIGITKAAGRYLRGPTCPPSQTCPPTPTVNLEREFEQPIGNLITDALLTKYKPLGAAIAMTNGGGIRAALPSSYSPGVFSAVTSAGTTPPSITLSGTPAAVYNMKIEVTTGGALGTMKFRWSNNGGTSWNEENVTSAADGKHVLGTTGITVTFAAGTYATDNVYTFTTKAFVRTGCSTTAPCDILLGDIFAVLPFGNRSTIRPMTPKLLWQVLENAVGKKPASDGRFMQVAGFKFSFSVSAPEGTRVKTIVLDDGTKLMDLTASPAVNPEEKTCTADSECGKNLACVEDVDSTKKCMIRVITNDFVNAGSETAPLKPGSNLGVVYDVMADDLVVYLKDKTLITPGAHNFVAPPTSTARVIELP